MSNCTASTGTRSSWTALKSRQKKGDRHRPQPRGPLQVWHRHPPSDRRAWPALGAVVTKAGANDGVQTQAVLEAMVVQPPPAPISIAAPDPRDLPRARADGAY